MQEIRLDIKYHEGQDEIFFRSKSRRRVVSKGRRWGFTKGAAQFVIESMLEGVSPILWGDTILPNIVNYFERYFLPVLVKLPQHLWQWKKHEKKLYINGAVCDFRSADQPENWEGFGYKIIILNEAGIILKNQYLWNNAVRPMLMDYPDSICIIGGTPKGKNLFYELWMKGQNDPEWQSFQYSSFTNPFVSNDEINSLIADLPASVVRQEIYAEFADESSHALIPYDLALECMKRSGIEGDGVEVWGLDVARHGDDFSALAKRNWKRVYEVRPYDINDTMQLASFVNSEYRRSDIKPVHIFVETTGIGWGVYDRLRELGCPVYPADVGLKSVMDGVLNKRAEMYVRLLKEMKEGLSLPDDRKLLRQLSAIEVEYNQRSIMKLTAKEKIKEEIGESPDLADAVALTYYEDVPNVTSAYRHEQVNDFEPFVEGIY